VSNEYKFEMMGRVLISGFS